MPSASSHVAKDARNGEKDGVGRRFPPRTEYHWRGNDYRPDIVFGELISVIDYRTVLLHDFTETAPGGMIFDVR